MEGCVRGIQEGSCPCSLLSIYFPVPLLQVAVIAGNFELGELIRNHREQDVGEWKGVGLKEELRVHVGITELCPD